MSRTKNIAVITIGYNNYAFEDAAVALQMMAMLSSAAQVEHSAWELRDDTPQTYFMVNEPSLPKLEFVPEFKFNTNETVKEVKERIQREKADRADMDQKFKEAPPALEAPVVFPEPEPEFF